MSDEFIDRRVVPYTRIRNWRGQKWVTEDDVENCEYVGYVGEVVRVQRLYGVEIYELAALMSPTRVGMTSRSRVWWLLPVSTEVTATELAAVSSTTKEVSE